MAENGFNLTWISGFTNHFCWYSGIVSRTPTMIVLHSRLFAFSVYYIIFSLLPSSSVPSFFVCWWVCLLSKATIFLVLLVASHLCLYSYFNYFVTSTATAPTPIWYTYLYFKTVILAAWGLYGVECTGGKQPVHSNIPSRRINLFLTLNPVGCGNRNRRLLLCRWVILLQRVFWIWHWSILW